MYRSCSQIITFRQGQGQENIGSRHAEFGDAGEALVLLLNYLERGPGESGGANVRNDHRDVRIVVGDFRNQIEHQNEDLAIQHGAVRQESLHMIRSGVPWHHGPNRLCWEDSRVCT